MFKICLFKIINKIIIYFLILMYAASVAFVIFIFLFLSALFY